MFHNLSECIPVANIRNARQDCAWSVRFIHFADSLQPFRGVELAGGERDRCLLEINQTSFKRWTFGQNLRIGQPVRIILTSFTQRNDIGQPVIGFQDHGLFSGRWQIN